MRNRRDVVDAGDLVTTGIQGAHRGFTTWTRALDPYFQVFQTVVFGRVTRVLSRYLGCERGALARAAETSTARGRPGQYIALTIGDRDDGVVEGRMNVRNTVRYRPGNFLTASAGVFL